jgi:hypothetical protein
VGPLSWCAPLPDGQEGLQNEQGRVWQGLAAQVRGRAWEWRELQLRVWQ